jgi:hypothetical protein
VSDYTLSEVRVAAPHAVGLLGGVDQQEEESESASRDPALRDAQLIDFPQQIVERCCARLTAATCARCNTQALDNVERWFSLETVNYAAERSREPANVVVKRNIFLAGRARRRYLRRHVVNGLLA